MRSRSAHRRSFRPRVEALEGRALLSVCLVDRLTDVGEGAKLAGDLRYCIEQAQDKDSIQFAVKGTINLTRALPDLTRSISIEGPGPGLLTVRRATGGFYRIFLVARSATVNISGLTIANGLVFDGGGGIVNAGTLTVSNSTLSGNGDFSFQGGGGIVNAGTLTVSNSTLSRNTALYADLKGFPLGTGGAIRNFFGGILSISNSTVSENTASAYGGGLDNLGSVSVTSSTFSRNNSTYVGGIYNSTDAILHMRSTILAQNSASTPDLGGRLTSSGYNLIGNSSGGSGFDKTDLLDVDPLLGPLENNGGPTYTHALLPGSPALDAGDPTDAPEWDQRGEGYWRIAGKNIDIGAYEEQGSDGPSPGRSPRFDVAILLADRTRPPILSAGVDDGDEVEKAGALPPRSPLEFVERVHAVNLRDGGLKMRDLPDGRGALHHLGAELTESKETSLIA